MFSELIVVILAENEDADKVWRTFERSQGGQLFNLIDIVLIRRDSQGKSEFQMRWKEPDNMTDNLSRMAGVFAEAIFGITNTEGRRLLGEAGVDPFFLQEVDRALKPGHSAFLIYVPREYQIDTRRYLELLERVPGKLHHTTFRPQVEEVLLNHNG